MIVADMLQDLLGRRYAATAGVFLALMPVWAANMWARRYGSSLIADLLSLILLVWATSAPFGVVAISVLLGGLLWVMVWRRRLAQSRCRAIHVLLSCFTIACVTVVAVLMIAYGLFTGGHSRTSGFDLLIGLFAFALAFSRWKLVKADVVNHGDRPETPL